LHATAASQPFDKLQSRKLLQCWGRGCNRGNDGFNQFNRNSAAIVNSQYAIRQAVESGAAPGVTRAAALYANVSTGGMPFV